MKTYSIGRDINCDIVITDSTDVVSRRHALLNVTSSGKMTIIDQSSNGTYVNGIRISQNVAVPVTRKDTISLAHVAKLDWSLVPKSNACVRYVLLGLLGVLIVVGAVFGIKALSDKKFGGGGKTNPTVVNVDTTAFKKTEQELRDSLAKAARADSTLRDSIKKANAARERKDSIDRAKKKEQQRKEKEAAQKEKKEEPSKPSTPVQDVG